MKVWHFHLIVCFSVSLLFPSTSLGQRQQIKEAMELFNEGQLTNAKQLIDDVVASKRARNNPNVWFAQGYIYTEFFRLHRQADTLLRMREVAYHGFTKFLDMDYPSEFREKVDKKMMFLATSYYGDAMRAVKEGKPERAENYYQWYRKCAEPVGDTYGKLGAEFEQRYRLALAEHYWNLTGNDHQGEHFLVKIRSNYSSVLSQNPGHPEANYRLSLLFYRQATGEWPCSLHESDYLLKQARIHLDRVNRENYHEQVQVLRQKLEEQENKFLNVRGQK